uniref:Uncharacterized protein n=1 Tax=viral metagenome TaxID=1070528 RepID=A0A6C0ATY9_9ZZZZ
MYKLEFRREGVDLLLYNQHLARLNSVDSTLKENHSKIPCYDRFHRTCILRCQKFDKQDTSLLERIASIARNTHLENTLGTYMENRIQSIETETGKIRSCSF